MMIIYDNFLQELNDADKKFKEVCDNLTKAHKAISKAGASGDLRLVDKNIDNISQLSEELKVAYEHLCEVVSSFDRNAFVNDGDYAKAIIEACKKADINVRQEGKTLEMFPNKVVINDETLDVSIDKKRQQMLNPQSVVDSIAKIQDKLKNAPFNAEKFSEEFAEAYDAVLRKSKKKDTWVKLMDIYKAMVPMARLRKEYDLQAFAYDLARLYNSDITYTKDGRSIEWDVSRSVKDPIRILNLNGKEEFLCKVKMEDSKL